MRTRFTALLLSLAALAVASDVEDAVLTAAVSAYYSAMASMILNDNPMVVSVYKNNWDQVRSELEGTFKTLKAAAPQVYAEADQLLDLDSVPETYDKTWLASLVGVYTQFLGYDMDVDEIGDMAAEMGATSTLIGSDTDATSDPGSDTSNGASSDPSGSDTDAASDSSSNADSRASSALSGSNTHASSRASNALRDSDADASSGASTDRLGSPGWRALLAPAVLAFTLGALC